jgi:hypothetical protein
MIAGFEIQFEGLVQTTNLLSFVRIADEDGVVLFTGGGPVAADRLTLPGPDDDRFYGHSE